MNEDNELAGVGSPQHLLAHLLLGAAVSAATGNDALTGGASAAVGEGQALLLSKYIYKTEDPSQLTAEQKDVISSIASLTGLALGATTGNVTDAVNAGETALVAVEDNAGTFDAFFPFERDELANVWGTKTRPITEKDFDKFVKSMSKTLGFDVEDAAIHIFTPLMAGSGSTANMVVSIGKSGIIISNKGRVVKQYSSAYLAKLAASRKASKSAASDLPSTNIGSNLPVITGTPIKQAGAAKNLDFSKVCSGTVCFTAGTLIHTIHGTKPIETIERGELVWSREESGDEYDYRPVIATKVTPNAAIFEVKIKHDNGLEETINTTEEHPFWIDGKGWRKASVLESGMKLLDKHGKATATVVSQTELNKTDTVYNFEVQDFSTYHIGKVGIWVHNANCCEIVLPPVRSFEQARNKALQLIDDVAPMGNSNPVIGRLEVSKGYGQVVGRQSLDGKVRWRLDYDDTKGLHFNVEDFRNGKGTNAKKYAIPIEGGTEADFVNYLKQLNR